MITIPSFSCKTLTEEFIPDTLHFLIKHEEQCVSLVSKFIDNGKTRLPINADCFIVFNTNTNKILGVVLITKSGLLLHYLDLCEIKGLSSDEQKKAFAELSNILRKKKLYCIMGEQNGTDFLLLLYEKKPTEIREYNLMIFNNNLVSLTELTNEYEIIKCNIHNADDLYTLQEIYDCAEVLPINEQFEPLRCKSNLLLQLKTMPFFAIKKNNQIIAKAGINAQGINYVQIGGVCTHPTYRCQKLAQHLVHHIIQFAIAQKKQVVLFANTQNTAANKAYEKQGFEFHSFFNIVYF